MSTGLQGDIHSRPRRLLPPLPAIGQRRPLGVKSPQLSMKPLADDRAIANHDRTHERIRAYPPPPVLRELQSPLQMSLIRGRKLGIHH
jgi:hypothetical protein